MKVAKKSGAVSGNGYGKRPLKRMEFVYGNIDITLAVNPEEYTQVEPAKVTLTQTKGGAWIDSWGAGIVEITIKGITGVKGHTNSIDVGYQRFVQLRDLFRKVYSDVKDGEAIGDNKLIKFYNHTDNEFFYCYPKPNGIELYRSKSRPHIYQYSISMYAIKKIGQAKKSVVIIGNPRKSISESTGKVSTTKSTITITKGGGTAGVTTSQVAGSDADRITTTVMRSKANADIVQDAIDCCKNLEPLIGGRQGKISPVTAYQCCLGLTVQSTGTVSNTQEFKLSDFVNESDNILYRNSRFISRVSVETYEIYKAMKQYSPEYMSETFWNVPSLPASQRVIHAALASKDYNSSLIESSLFYRSKSYISKHLFKCIKVILLESMMIYIKLYKVSEVVDFNIPLVLGVTDAQVQNLINNIVALNFYIQLTTTDMNRLYVTNIKSDLRHLEKVHTQIKADIVTYL